MPSTAYFDEVSLNTWVPCGPAVFQTQVSHLVSHQCPRNLSRCSPLTNILSKMIGFLEICVFLFVVLHILRIYFADCDAVLHFYERFAKPPDKRLRSKVIWITGASSGIGKHLAYKLTEFGCKLVLSVRRKDELDRVKSQCMSKFYSKLFQF